MDSSLPEGSFCKKKRLSAPRPRLHGDPVNGGDLPSQTSLDFYTSSKNTSSLDRGKKKVGQSPASRCENPYGMYFICDHGHPVYRTLPCHARFAVDCPYCAKKWRKKLVDEYSEKVSRMEYPAMVTLTLKKNGAHVLRDLNGFAHRCRKYLRRKGYNIRACVSCIDPPNHIHCIWDCGYIPYKKLSEMWKAITGDSFIVDIRKVDRQRWYKAVYYITKYITKISDTGCDVDLRGVHVVTSWGKRIIRTKIRMVCKKCGSYFELLWFCGRVGDYDNDPVDFVEINNDYG